jgi:uncharacterized protein (TIGR02145 family)
VQYGELVDDRDGRKYKTVKIGGQVWMAENLNYADEGAHSYLIGNNSCYNDDTTNCLKGGRYYSWTAAMDIDEKWKNARVPAGTIKSPHQGICPDGWHIPSVNEWKTLWSHLNGSNIGESPFWDPSGFALKYVGQKTDESDFIGVDDGIYFATKPGSISEYDNWLWSWAYQVGSASYGYGVGVVTSFVRCMKN